MPTDIPSSIPTDIPYRSRAEDLLDFWFGAPNEPDYSQYRKVWFVKDASFDALIRQRFEADVEQAATGKYDSWQSFPESGVALLLLLDQFPRNLYRGSDRSFAADEQALKVAKHLVDTGSDAHLPARYRFFIYVPYEHSERIADQNRCVALMERLMQDVFNPDEGLKNGLDYAIRHRDVIERFGRFPHRNEVLGRQSTPEEAAFLEQPGSRF